MTRHFNFLAMCEMSDASKFTIFQPIVSAYLKQVEGLSRPLPLAFTVVGYVIAFSLMSLSLKTIPIGIAYAVWSGVGIVAISIIGLIAFGQRLDTAALAGIALIVSGVAVIQLFSKSQA